MVACKPPCLLTAVDAAYIAGLIDGEGTITLARKQFESAVLQIKP